MPTVHHVLWTGGWDSTFRVADLVITHGRVVQPIYVRDPRRRTSQRELDTMVAQVAMLERMRPGAAALVRPIHVIDLADLPRDPSITTADARVATGLSMYEQYHWIPHLPSALGRDDIELCWQNDGTFRYFPPSAYLVESSPAPDDWHRLDPAQCDPDRLILFERFRFPVIHLTKPQMADLAAERGFLPVLESSWTCRWPTVLGNPCGFCVPCEETRAEGLAHRVPRPTRTRRALHRAKWDLVRRGTEARIRLAAAGDAVRGRGADRTGSRDG